MKSVIICKGCGKGYETSFLRWQNTDLCKECFDKGVVVPAQPHTPSLIQTVPYTSTYFTARAIATLISAIGWIAVAISALLLIVAISGGGMTRLFLLPSLGGALSGLLLVGVGQLTRATVDTADNTGEMLAIIRATQLPKE